MCYNLQAALLDELQYAIHRGDEHAAEALRSKLEELNFTNKPTYFVSGFSHPKILVFTNEEPMKPQLFVWGLVPSWAKDFATANVLRKKTLNARVETMFDLPSFKSSAKSKRCLVYVDAFYEYHSVGKKKYPFRIAMKDGAPMTMAGLWSEWTDKTSGEVMQSFAIVTTEANDLMAKIHNLPAASDTPRMPLILSKEKQDEWLIDLKSDADKEHIMSLAKPYAAEEMSAYTVPQLIGKNGVGNTVEATKEFVYEELEF